MADLTAQELTLEDYNNLAVDVNNKLDKDLSNIAYETGLRRLVDVGGDETSFYKIFEEINPKTGERKKWGECYGVATTPVTVTLPIEYKDNTYWGFATFSATTADYTQNLNLYDKTTTSFYLKIGGTNYKYPVNWKTEGYIN